MIRCVAFDLDGVVLPSAPSFAGLRAAKPEAAYFRAIESTLGAVPRELARHFPHAVASRP